MPTQPQDPCSATIQEYGNFLVSELLREIWLSCAVRRVMRRRDNFQTVMPTSLEEDFFIWEAMPGLHTRTQHPLFYPLDGYTALQTWKVKNVIESMASMIRYFADFDSPDSHRGLR